MTLFKQMAIGTSLLITILLATVMAINYQSAKKDMIQSLYETTVNNIATLTSKLAEAGEERALLESTIDAEFDGGYFKMIEFTSSEGSYAYKQEDTDPVKGVPAWFVKFADIHPKPASVDVSSGWSILGNVKVTGDTSVIYKGLYKIFLQLIYIFIIFFIAALSVLNIMLHYILKPLKDVQKQAEAVTRNEFIMQNSIPNTKEFKDVVLGMNNMVSKVKAMFEKGNEELKRQKELEYTDATTKLKNRKYLIDKLPEYLKIDASSKGGINMMVAFNGVIEANEAIGHRDVDKLFVDISNIFKAHADNYENSIVCRMNGTEFAILLPDCSAEEAMELAEGMQMSVGEIISACGLDTKTTYISIGLYEYSYKQNIGQLLSLSDNALTQAKFNESHIHMDKAEQAVEVMGKEAWRKIITDALNTSAFRFVSYTTVDTKHKKIAHNALSLTMKADDGTSYSYGQFMAPANQAGLSSSIYKNIIEMMFKRPDMKLKSSICSLRLSYEFLSISETCSGLGELLKEYGHKLPFKLIIEMPDKFMRKNSEQVKRYKTLFQTYNIDMGIYEFIGESEDYQYLQDLRPVYIKAESSYFLSQSEQSLSALRLITDTVGISLIAVGVMDMETLAKLQTKDVHIIQGRATEMIKLA